MYLLLETFHYIIEIMLILIVVSDYWFMAEHHEGMCFTAQNKEDYDRAAE